MTKPKSNRWWRWKFHLLREIPKRCPYCGGEVIIRGFKEQTRKIECRDCEMVLIDFY